MNKVKKTMDDSKANYYTSQEVKAKLKISGCRLMHLRESGDIAHIKKGNAYLYSIKDVLRFMEN